MAKSNYTPIDKIIKSAKKGEMYILVDDENRENEGDLVVPASNVSPNKINFMARYGRGLICLAITDKQAKKLNLSLPKIPIVRHDERFTSKIASNAILESGIGKRKRQDKLLVDKVSATILLQSYLSTQKNI